MSPFFWYNGYRGKHFKLFPYHKAGLLRFDDPGNMCYGVTGKLLISAFDNDFEKWVLTEAAEIYAMRGYMNSSEAYKQRILEQGGRYDDPHDIAAIKWGYESPFVPNKPFLWEIFLFYKNKIHRR